MIRRFDKYARVLGVDPTSNGFGFVVLEASGRPVDWGIKEFGLKGKRQDRELVRRIDPIIWKYSPAVIALEDCADIQGRSDKALRLIDTLLGYAKLLDVGTMLLTRSEIRAALGLSETATKHETAQKVAETVPALKGFLPEKRKPWKGEPSDMNVFDAAGLALAAMVLKFPDQQAA